MERDSGSSENSGHSIGLSGQVGSVRGDAPVGANAASAASVVASEIGLGRCAGLGLGAAIEEYVIDLSDLDIPDVAECCAPRDLVVQLERHFDGDEAKIRAALEGYEGRYETIADYVAMCLDSDGIAEWLIPYIDCAAIGSDWCDGGTIWTLEVWAPDVPGARPGGIHVFLS